MAWLHAKKKLSVRLQGGWHSHCRMAMRHTLPVRTIPTRSKRNGVDQHTYLMSLQERNERLFYYVLSQVCKRGAVLSCALGSAGCARPD